MKSVLVTGAGRGIGKATALHLVNSGWDVYAGVRKIEDGDALVAEAGQSKITPVILDVTDRAQIAALDDALPATLDAIVNNAGIVVDGPIEGLPPEELRRQFDVNVLGTIEVTQRVLPKIRAARGRVVFLSSVSGRISTPWTGAYNGSKFALEGLVDALRMELRPWGVRVSLVEPSATDTDMWGDAITQFDSSLAALSDQNRQLYANHAKGMRRTMKFMQKQTAPVKTVVGAIDKALTSPRPRARYVVGAVPKIQLVASALTPTAINDFVLARATGIPRKA